MGEAPAHRLTVRVYYEDTDLAGIVYYANYLRFFERGRTELLRAAGVDQTRLKAEAGLVFVVARIAIDYLSPARFDDLIEVETRLIRLRAATAEMAQSVWRGETCLARADVRLAVTGPDGRPARMPGEIAEALSGPA